MVKKAGSRIQDFAFRALVLWFSLFAALYSIPSALGQTQPFTAANLNNVRYVSGFPGADLGAKLAACFADLPSTGGTCDARGLEGNQTISANPFESLPINSSGPLAGLAVPVTVLFGAATVTTVPLVMPAAPAQGIRIEGLGVTATFFRPSAANQLIFQGPQSTGTICDQCYLGNFTVQAHASGSTGTAIDTVGFRDSTFEGIQYSDSTYGVGGGNFASFFHFATYPNLDYGNRIIHPVIDGSGNPATVFLFDNGGMGNALYNCQVALIEDPWIYSTTGIITIFDARRSAGVVIRGGLIEANTNATILVPGSFTTFENVWIDTNVGATLVSAQTGSDGSSNAVVLRNNWIAPSGFSITIPNWASDWVVVGNEPSVNLTITDSGTNNLVQYGATMDGGSGNSAPLRLRSSNAAGANIALTHVGATNPNKYLRSLNGHFQVIDSAYSQAILDLSDGGALATIVNTVNFSTTPSFDASRGNTQRITLTGSVTSSTLANAVAGEQINFMICQDGSGNRTFTWPSNVKGGMTIGSTASKCSAQTFIFDGTNAYALSAGATNL